MYEANEFSHFVIESNQAGSPVAVFYRRAPGWQLEGATYGSIGHPGEAESRFDAPSLETRIRNLRRLGLDASMSEAALSALRNAVTVQGQDVAPHAGEPAPPVFLTGLVLSPVVEMTQDAVVVTTAGPGEAEPVILYVNPAAERLTGYASGELVGSHLSVLYGPDTSRESAATIRRAAVAGKGGQDRVLLYPKEGRPFWFDLNVTPLAVPGGEGFAHSALVGRPAHHLGAGAYQLESTAQRDPITGLHNRQVLIEAIAADLQTPSTPRERAPYLGYISIDGLDQIEAELGELVANATLLGVADRLAENVRLADTVCSLGGPDFVVFMRGLGLRDAKSAVERMRRMITARPVETVQGPMPVAISVGVIEARWKGQEGEPGEILDSLLASARNALSSPVAAL